MPYIVTHDTSTGSRPKHPQPEGVTTSWLVSSADGGATRGMIAQLQLAAGGSQSLHAHATAEEAAFVLAGDTVLLTAAGDLGTPAGTLVLSAPGVSHGFRAGPEPAQVLLIYAGPSDVDALDVTAGRLVDLRTPETVHVPSLVLDPFHHPEMGFFNMSARFLVSEGGLPATSLVIGRSAYGEPELGGGHVLHRHPVAEEFLYLLDGEARHLTEDGEMPMRAGDLAFIPPTEWHGIWNVGETPSHALFGFLGLNNIEAGGYELHPAAHPLTS